MGGKNLSLRLGPVLLLLTLFASLGMAQVKTTITDTLYGPDGKPAKGSMTVRAHQTFTASDGTTVNTGIVATTTFTSTGGFSVDLVPNIGGAPQGNYYDVEYASSTSRVNETWIVPVSAPALKLAAVRVIFPKAQTITIPIAQVTAPPGCNATEGTVWAWTSTGWACKPSNIGNVTLALENPTPVDSGKFEWKTKSDLTLTRVSCSTDTGNVVVNFEIRGEANPNSGGAQVLTTSVTCTPTTGSSTIFTNSAVPGLSPVALLIDSISGAPGVVRVHAEYKLN